MSNGVKRRRVGQENYYPPGSHLETSGFRSKHTGVRSHSTVVGKEDEQTVFLLEDDAQTHTPGSVKLQLDLSIVMLET